MPYDGLVCLFSVRNDATDRDIDYDEVRSDEIGSKKVFSFVLSLLPITLSEIKIADTFRQMIILDVNFLFSHYSDIRHCL